MADNDSIDRPVHAVDVDDLRKRLAAAATIARYVVEHLGDLETLAYDKTVGGEGRSSRGTRDGGFLTDVGDRRAKLALDRLDAGVTMFAAALAGAAKVIESGGDADHTLRGTMLGSGDGRHPADVHAALVKKQNTRRNRGDYTPARVVPQPKPVDNRRKKKR